MGRPEDQCSFLRVLFLVLETWALQPASVSSSEGPLLLVHRYEGDELDYLRTLFAPWGAPPSQPCLVGQIPWNDSFTLLILNI